MALATPWGSLGLGFASLPWLHSPYLSLPSYLRGGYQSIEGRADGRLPYSVRQAGDGWANHFADHVPSLREARSGLSNFLTLGFQVIPAGT